MNTLHSRTLDRLHMLRSALGRNKEDGTEAEEGFTLIELMVVLLIMAILLAIAIPTFLGVTGGAKVTAAQSDLTNVLTAAKSIVSSTGKYPATATLASKLHSSTPSVSFVVGTGLATSAGNNTVTVKEVTTQVATFTIMDANKDCWGVADNETTSTVATLPSGETYYWKAGTTCKATTVKSPAWTEGTSWKGGKLKAHSGQ